jgi:hypothetical protein
MRTRYVLYRYVVLDNYDIIPSNDIVKNIPSAGRGHWLTGHFRQYYSSDDPDVFSTECYNRLGPIHRISGFFGVRGLRFLLSKYSYIGATNYLQQKRIVVQDSKALAHVIKNAYDYPKNNIVRGEMGRGIGHGLLYVEGEDLLYSHVLLMFNDTLNFRGQPQATTQDVEPSFLTNERSSPCSSFYYPRPPSKSGYFLVISTIYSACLSEACRPDG